MDNSWSPGEPTVQKKTIFDIARRFEFASGYFYSKEKLGYLVNDTVDVHRWSRENSVDLAEAFIKTPGRHFVFLHISGLDQIGPQYGWLSSEYLEELSFINDYLQPLLELIISSRHFLIVVTSDHAGHGKIHGSNHQEDYRLPFIISSDIAPVKDFQDISFSVIDLKSLLESLMQDLSF